MSDPAFDLVRDGDEDPLRSWRTADTRRVFINALTLDASIGVHPHEREATQPVVFSIEIEVIPAAALRSGERGVVYAPPIRPGDAAAHDVVCYESLSNRVRDLLAQGHIDYVEELVARVADAVFEDGRVRRVRIRAEKPDAIADAGSVGVEIVKSRRDDLS